jgi:hypothetical protein
MELHRAALQQSRRKRTSIGIIPNKPNRVYHTDADPAMAREERVFGRTAAAR